MIGYKALNADMTSKYGDMIFKYYRKLEVNDINISCILIIKNLPRQG